MSKNNLISLSEFRQISGISHSELIRLLELGLLPVSVDESGKVCLNSAQIDAEKLSLHKLDDPKPLFSTDRDLLEEIVASSIVQALDTVVDEAIDLALSWETPASDKVTESEENN
jgi:hypothetical protein